MHIFNDARESHLRKLHISSLFFRNLYFHVIKLNVENLVINKIANRAFHRQKDYHLRVTMIINELVGTGTHNTKTEAPSSHPTSKNTSIHLPLGIQFHCLDGVLVTLSRNCFFTLVSPVQQKIKIEELHVRWK